VREENLVVGRDIALVAFDDLEWAQALSRPLTAAAQPFHAIGARAVQLLARRLDDRWPAARSSGCPLAGAPAQLRLRRSGPDRPRWPGASARSVP